MKKITFFTLHLGFGGVEKALSCLANELVDKYNIEIIATYKLFEKPAFKLDNRIKVKYLISNDLPLRLSAYRNLLKAGHIRTLLNALWEDYLKRFKMVDLFKDYKKGMTLLRKKEKRNIVEIKNCKSDIIISTCPYLDSLVGKYGSKESFKIGWEHNHHHNNKKYIKEIKSSTIGLDAFVVVSEKLADFYKDILNCKVYGIPNFLDDIINKKTDLNINSLISVGRLSEEKGFVDLIKTFKYVNDMLPDAVLNIVGDGQERKNVEKAIRFYGLKDNIVLHGYQSQDYINDLYQHSSLYLMTSYTESFGLVLAESMSYGVPCVAFTSAEGANDLIINGVNGYLINDRNNIKMANKIVEVLNDRELLSKLSENSYKSSKKYSKDSVILQWKKLLNNKL